MVGQTPAQIKARVLEMAAAPDSWNPAAIWANWPTMLDELKIASPTAWK